MIKGKLWWSTRKTIIFNSNSGETYSLDWLAPAGIPLFTGAEAYSIKNAKNNEKGSISSDDNKNQSIDTIFRKLG